MGNILKNGSIVMVGRYLSVVVLVIGAGKLYQLGWIQIVVLSGMALVCLPGILKNDVKNRQAKQNFIDANIYMEQGLYSFQKMPKIMQMLNDVEHLFPEGNMKQTLEEALHYMHNSYTDEELSKNALGMIEEKYKNSRIESMHRFMIKTEELGGEYRNSIRILLSDRSSWESQVTEYQKECRAWKRNIGIAIVLTGIMCAVTPMLCTKMMQQISITNSRVYQWSSVSLLLIFLLVYMKSDKRLAGNWMEEKRQYSEEEIRKKYQKVVSYDAKKGQMKSMLWAFLPGALSFLAGWSGHRIFMILLLGGTVILLNQHKFDHFLAVKAVKREIEKAFPRWMMELSLLLQTNNVKVSIARSEETAPEVLRPALRQLLESLAEKPESNEPYAEFLREFHLPKIQSAMGMLYSIDAGNGGMAADQIEEILKRNMELTHKAEQLENQDKVGAMYGMFLMPALMGALKMVMDMTLILFSFFQTMQY